MTLAAAIPSRLPVSGRTYDGPVQVHGASDEWLAARAAKGDTAAFEELVLRHQDMLYTLALRVTLNEADARDCVQEGLLAAWRSIGRFRGDARFSTWAYRIVLRKAYDALDRRKRLPDPTDELPATTADPPAEDRLDITAALATLEPDFRAVAVACDVIGLSMEEAADVLGVPTGTVKSRLFRARERLAEQLAMRKEPS
jgi:RNA polymerase sigma-70 factor (ECF subfamily)